MAPTKETPQGTDDDQQQITDDDTGGASDKPLFDPAMYQDPKLKIDQVDDHEIQKIKVSVSGSVILDRTNPDHVAFYNALKLGKQANVVCSGRVGGVAAKGSTNREGNLDVVMGEKSIIVDTVRLIPAEEL